MSSMTAFAVDDEPGLRAVKDYLRRTTLILPTNTYGSCWDLMQQALHRLNLIL